METRTIFLIGKPGCGKGTQAALLAKHTGWKTFGSGTLFRELEREDTPAGRKLKRENDAGALSPYWFASYLFLKSLFSLPERASAIFDGFNRRVHEAELIVSSLTWLERPFSIVYLAVSDEEVRRRLGLRREVDGRADDGAVDERLKEYYEHTEKAVAVFRDAGTLVEIDGECAPEEVARQMRVALGIA